MFVDAGNLWCKIWEGYINYPEAQKLLGELRKIKVLEEVKLVDGLFKYKQSWVYVPQGKFRLSVLTVEYDSHIAAHKRKKKTGIEWCQGGTVSRFLVWVLIKKTHKAD